MYEGTLILDYALTTKWPFSQPVSLGIQSVSPETEVSVTALPTGKIKFEINHKVQTGQIKKIQIESCILVIPETCNFKIGIAWTLEDLTIFIAGKMAASSETPEVVESKITIN